jgi:hypothetical protein
VIRSTRSAPPRSSIRSARRRRPCAHDLPRAPSTPANPGISTASENDAIRLRGRWPPNQLTLGSAAQAYGPGRARFARGDRRRTHCPFARTFPPASRDVDNARLAAWPAGTASQVRGAAWGRIVAPDERRNDYSIVRRQGESASGPAEAPGLIACSVSPGQAHRLRLRHFRVYSSPAARVIGTWGFLPIPRSRLRWFHRQAEAHGLKILSHFRNMWVRPRG